MGKKITILRAFPGKRLVEELSTVGSGAQGTEILLIKEHNMALDIDQLAKVLETKAENEAALTEYVQKSGLGDQEAAALVAARRLIGSLEDVLPEDKSDLASLLTGTVQKKGTKKAGHTDENVPPGELPDDEKIPKAKKTKKNKKAEALAKEGAGDMADNKVEYIMKDGSIDLEVITDDGLKSGIEAIQKENAELKTKQDNNQTALEKVQKEVTDLKDTNEMRDLVAKCEKDYPHVGDATKLATVLKNTTEAGQRKILEETLASSQARLAEAGLLAIVGKDGTDEAGGDAYSKITALAKERADKKSITVEKAFSEVLIENPALYDEYNIEKSARTRR